MSWIIDGNNLLGAMRLDRVADGPKRDLVRLLASFARAKRTKVVCCFDGPEPPSFARSLGGVSVVFSGARSADELIERRVEHGRGWNLVTNDGGLARRVEGRRVRVVAPAAFVRELESAAAEGGGEAQPAEDWAAWFADPKNRNVF